ncbi:hypothetical protein CBR_g32084 [Chara braunii]|uniref:Uncharacterized protein n=1 Tax=Chara braunii TaxID=69332 RepID=A0A388LGI0_CHABU|nr:hypothetical protein CBR_g32084 [Chara braunii]|eukprot:GBG81409.1 hypothetical protein CBR_g32084 [Chara braunii]
MKERHDWPKNRENLLTVDFDQILYRLLKQQKEDRERVQLGSNKDKEVYKTISDMKEMMTSLKEEPLKLQVMMAKTKTGKRKGKEPVTQASSSESDSEEEKEPSRKLTKAERKALNQIRGGQGTSRKRGESSKDGGNGSGSNKLTKGNKAKVSMLNHRVVETVVESAETVADMGTGRITSANIDGLAPAAASAPEATPMAWPMTMSRLVFKRGMPTIMVQTRKGRKTSQSQPAPGESSKRPQEKEPIQIEEGDDEEEDERLRAEDELLAKQRAMERDSEAGKAKVEEEEPRKKKNVYTMPVENRIDFEQFVDRILESQRDLVTLKEIIVVSPKLREEFKHRMTRKKVMRVKLSEIIPPEANRAPPGTKMD